MYGRNRSAALPPGFFMYGQERALWRRTGLHQTHRRTQMSEVSDLLAAMVRLPSVNPSG